MADRPRDHVTDNQYLVLKALVPGPLHGYAIRKVIQDGTEGKLKLSLATLYDALHRLLEDGLIQRHGDKVIQGRVRRTYRITGLGERATTEKELLLQGTLGHLRPVSTGNDGLGGLTRA